MIKWVSSWDDFIIARYNALIVMILLIIVPFNLLWFLFMFSPQKILWNLLIGRTCLSRCSAKWRFGASKSQYFSWSIHKLHRYGEWSSVIETVAPMIVTESPPREYSRSSYLSISFYLPVSLAYFVWLLSPLCRTSWPSLSLTLRFAL